MRDREFCTVDHRKKYGSRLGKALHELAAPEPPPAALAGFVADMPVQSPTGQVALSAWTPFSCICGQSYSQWPIALDVLQRECPRQLADPPAPLPEAPLNSMAGWNHWLSLPAFSFDVLAPTYGLAFTEMATAAKEANPPECRKPMSAPEPDPVFTFVQSVSALAPLSASPAIKAAHLAAALESLSGVSQAPTLAASTLPMRAPGPEPVWAFVQSAITLEPLALASTCAPLLPQFTVQAELEPLPVPEQPVEAPAACELPMRAPQADPVWAFVQPSAAIAALAPAPAAVQLPRFSMEFETLPLLERPMRTPAACQIWMSAPEAEPVWAFVQPTVELSALELAPAALQLPRFTGELEALPVLDQSIQPPAERQGWMRVPEPEPVFSFVRVATAGSMGASIAASAPEGAALRMAGPHIPSVATFQTIPEAEPVMAGVWPHVADIPFEPICNPTAVRLPDINVLRLQSGLAPQVPASETRVTGAPAEAAETLLCASQATIPLPAAMPEFALPQVAASVLLVGNGAPQLAGAASGPAPDALESLLSASSAGQIKSATVVRLQPFAVAASEERTVPGFDAPRLAPPVSRPRAAAAKVVVMPIQTIQVAAPAPPAHRPVPSIPQPGLMPLEFHAQRLRGDAVTRLEWRNSRFAPAAPGFSLRTVWERAEDLVAQKPAPKKSTMAEVFALPEAKRKNSRWVGYVAKIAAGIVVVMATWYGAGSIKEHSLQGRTNISTAVPSVPAVRAESRSARAGKPEASGPIARVRQSIASRAAVQYSDNMREGMEAWGAAAKTYPAGWSRGAEGYVNTGALALFAPTRNFTDYQLEFFGQIENKSMGWTVRAKDPNNYHAMKFTVIESGLRPVIAMVHYNVIDGKAGRRTQTPLNIMVHNRTPIQVAVNVKGNHFVTSIDGEEVDSYMDDALASGGVGFFSEASEKARLYWVKVSKNDDWLGHVCAFLSGVDAAPAVSEIWPPELPGSHSPWSPDSERASLAGAWIALPYIRASRKARSVKSRRYQEWNT